MAIGEEMQWISGVRFRQCDKKGYRVIHSPQQGAPDGSNGLT